VIPITGRPAGWCDHIARFWPVDGVVGENGAFWFRYDRGARRLVKRFLVGDAERAANRRRLEKVGEAILKTVPGTALASDQLYREADLAIDFCEDVPRLDQASVDRIVALMEAEGMSAKLLFGAVLQRPYPSIRIACLIGYSSIFVLYSPPPFSTIQPKLMGRRMGRKDGGKWPLQPLR
jgi:hypothetical protein